MKGKAQAVKWIINATLRCSFPSWGNNFIQEKKNPNPNTGTIRRAQSVILKDYLFLCFKNVF
jgi:hypothetical protein